MPYAAVNGLNMYYEVHGAGEPLLLLHGGASSIPEKWIPLFMSETRAIPDAQLCVTPNTGHGTMPAATILAFLREDRAGDE